jgi:hypothetical protein
MEPSSERVRVPPPGSLAGHSEPSIEAMVAMLGLETQQPYQGHLADEVCCVRVTGRPASCVPARRRLTGLVQLAARDGLAGCVRRMAGATGQASSGALRYGLATRGAGDRPRVMREATVWCATSSSPAAWLVLRTAGRSRERIERCAVVRGQAAQVFVPFGLARSV